MMKLIFNFQRYNIMHNIYTIILIKTLLIVINTICQQNCLYCAQQKCLSCRQNRYMTINGKCIEQKIQNCLIYNDKSQCLLCEITYILENQSCKKIYSGCTQINIFNQFCHKCQWGTIFNNGQCVGTFFCRHYQNTCVTCQNGFKLVNGKCYDTNIGCNVITDIGLCKYCRPGFIMVGYRCVPEQIETRACVIYDSNAQCSSCQPGYNVYKGYCLANYQLIQIQRGAKSLQQIVSAFPKRIHDHCAQQTQLECIKCNKGYYNNNGKCERVSRYCFEYDKQGQCMSCIQNVQFQDGKCIDSNCIRMKQQNCIECKQGYDSIYGICNKLQSNCSQYHNNTLECKICFSGYFINQSDYKCHKLPIGCQNYTTTCQQCSIQYRLINGICKQLPRNCMQSNPFNQFSCLACQDGYYLFNHLCHPVSSYCLQFNQKYVCSSCKQHFITKNNTCVDPYCLIMTGEFCSVCSEHYALNEHSLCSINDTNCIKSSIDSCIVCKQGFYKGSQLLCQTNPPFCLRANSSGLCLQCQTKYILNQSALCQHEPITIQNCLQVNQTSKTCTVCITGYYSSGSSCMKNPLGCKNFTNKCQQCLNDQEWVLYRYNCVYLMLPAVFQNTSCNQFVDKICVQCKNRFVFRPPYYWCQPINPLCKNYYPNGQCSACYQSFRLTKLGKCIRNILSEDPNCYQYVWNGYCKKCNYGYKIQNGRCAL